MFWSIALAVAVAYTVLRVQWICRGNAFLYALDFIRRECKDEKNLLNRLTRDVRSKFTWTMVFTLLFWGYFFYIGVIYRVAFATDRQKKYWGAFPGLHTWPIFREINSYVLDVASTLFEPFIGMTVAAQTGIICTIHRSSFNVLMYHMLKRDRRIHRNGTTGDDDVDTPLSVPQLIEMHRFLDGMLNKSSHILELPITAMGTLYCISFLSCLYLLLFRPPVGETGQLDLFFVIVAIFFCIGVCMSMILSDTAKVTAKCARLAEIASFASRHYQLYGEHPPPNSPQYARTRLQGLVSDRTMSRAVAESISKGACSATTREVTTDKNKRPDIGRFTRRLLRVWRRVKKEHSERREGDLEAGLDREDTLGSRVHLVEEVGAPVQKARTQADTPTGNLSEAMQQILLVQYLQASNTSWRVYGVKMTSTVQGRILYTVGTLIAVGLQRALSTSFS